MYSILKTMGIGVYAIFQDVIDEKGFDIMLDKIFNPRGVGRDMYEALFDSYRDAKRIIINKAVTDYIVQYEGRPLPNRKAFEDALFFDISRGIVCLEFSATDAFITFDIVREEWMEGADFWE